MHAVSHFNGGILKPRVGLCHVSFKTIVDNYLRVFPLSGQVANDFFYLFVLFKVLRQMLRVYIDFNCHIQEATF